MSAAKTWSVACTPVIGRSHANYESYLLHNQYLDISRADLFLSQYTVLSGPAED